MRGTTAERSTGTWRLRVVTGYDAEDRPQQLSRTVQGTKRQAQSALAKFVAEVGQGTAPLSGSLTFGRYLEERWLPHADAVREPTRPKGTEQGEQPDQIARRPIRLDKLTADHIDSILRSWEQTLQPSTLRATVGTASAAWSRRAAGGSYRPTRLAWPPSHERRAEGPRCPLSEQVVVLIDAAAADGDPTLAALLSLAAVTGLRRPSCPGCNGERSPAPIRANRTGRIQSGTRPAQPRLGAPRSGHFAHPTPAQRASRCAVPRELPCCGSRRAAGLLARAALPRRSACSARWPTNR